MVASEMASKVGKAFAMMSNTYTFELYDDAMPEPFKKSVLHNCRVVAVVVHESEVPEVLVFDPADNSTDFYRIDDLNIVDVLQQAA